tara:strand:- start:280 stop:1446 length:1167 start_codon:yes stop_codon:yes gene_type:complete
MNNINSVEINSSTLAKIGANRQLLISGEDGANFSIIIATSEGKFYDFTDRSFSLGHTPQKVLKSQINGSDFQTVISFPSVTSDINYDVIVIPGDNTQFAEDQIENIRIEQVGNSVVTFSLTTNNTANYETFPTSVTLEGSSAGGSDSVVFEYTIQNKNDNTGGFGLIINTTQPVTANSVVFTTTATADGGQTSDLILLNSVDNIAVGSQATSLTGSPKILSIDGNTVKLTSSVTVTDSQVITFKSIGQAVISKATGMGFRLDDCRADPATFPTTTVRGAVSNSNAVNVNGTRGISGGSVVVFGGAGVDNSSGNNINSVTASETQGSFECDVNQTLVANTPLSFKTVDPSKVLCNSILIRGRFQVDVFPSSDLEVSIDLDTFITPGTQS